MVSRPPVDAVLAAPGAGRLLADPQIAGHVSDAAPGLNKIKNLPAELRRATPSAHARLLVSGHQNPVIRLRRGRDTPVFGLTGAVQTRQATRFQHGVTVHSRSLSCATDSAGRDPQAPVGATRLLATAWLLSCRRGCSAGCGRAPGQGAGSACHRGRAWSSRWWCTSRSG